MREGASSSAPCVVKDSHSLNEAFEGLVDGCGGSWRRLSGSRQHKIGEIFRVPRSSKVKVRSGGIPGGFGQFTSF